MMDKKTNQTQMNATSNGKNDQFTIATSFMKAFSRKTIYFSATIAFMVGWIYVTKNYAMFFNQVVSSCLIILVVMLFSHSNPKIK